MEYLIKEAFLHVENYGPHVADGHYDLLGPKDEIIMPSIWDTLIEPGWEISMHMWPIPEPPPAEPGAEESPEIVIVDEGVPPPPPSAPSAHSGKIDDGVPETKTKKTKKEKKIPSFTIWTAGKSYKSRGAVKGKKK